jgi:hypothetical protein
VMPKRRSSAFIEIQNSELPQFALLCAEREERLVPEDVEA